MYECREDFDNQYRFPIKVGTSSINIGYYREAMMPLKAKIANAIHTTKKDTDSLCLVFIGSGFGWLAECMVKRGYVVRCWDNSKFIQINQDKKQLENLKAHLTDRHILGDTRTQILEQCGGSTYAKLPISAIDCTCMFTLAKELRKIKEEVGGVTVITEDFLPALHWEVAEEFVDGVDHLNIPMLHIGTIWQPNELFPDMHEDLKSLAGIHINGLTGEVY